MFGIKYFTLLVALLASVSQASLNDKFNDWKERFQIHFNNEFEDKETFRKWVDNDRYISAMNSKNLTYVLDHNQFSGMDSSDFKNYLGYSNNRIDKIKNKILEGECLEKCIKEIKNVAIKDTYNCVSECLEHVDSLHEIKTNPDSIDWVEKGAVTPVKNQGQCGSCWSFSTTGALEGAYYIKNNKLESFSEQQLVDCDNFKNGGRDHGCNGGLMDNAFNWIKNNNGLCSESEYPYTSGTTQKSSSCDTKCNIISNSDIINFVDVTASSDEEMMSALAQQPVSIAIQADQKEFQFYKSGVFVEECGTKLDHGVLAVGYGTDSGQDYYKVKNSWGESWGENGYILLGRGAKFNNGDGQCGMLLQASYPVL